MQDGLAEGLLITYQVLQPSNFQAINRACYNLEAPRAREAGGPHFGSFPGSLSAWVQN